MKLHCLHFAGLIILLGCCFTSYSQQTPETALNYSSDTSLRQLYFNEIGNNAQIYHGVEFIRNGTKVAGFPFFASDELFTGSVSYQGTLYTNRRLQYNLLTDELISTNYSNSGFLTLSSEKVDSFQIADHSFIKLHPNKSNRLPKEGFYDELYSGEPGVYVNRYKKYVPASGSIDSKYTAYDEYYIRKENIFYRVDGRNDLLELFSDRKDELKKYMRVNKIKFNKDPESALKRITIYYSSLKH